MLLLRCALAFSTFIISFNTGFTEPTRTVQIMDKQGFGTPLVAYTIEVPQSWSAEGQILWNKPCSGNDYYELVFVAKSADGRTGYRIKPGHQVIWIDSVVTGFDPATAQMILAQDEAQRNKMRTQFRNSNCHVGKVTGSDQLLQQLVLRSRPRDAKRVSTAKNEPMLKSYKQTFGPDMPGLRTFYDATIVKLAYLLGGAPIEETLFFSWYMFQLEPLDAGYGVFSQQTFVESIRFVWLAPERRAQDEAALATVTSSLKVGAEWQRQIDEFRAKIARQNREDQAERDRRRKRDEARRDAEHQQFIEWIQQ